MERLERSNFSLKVRSVEPDGSFVGMGAVFNNRDLGNDLIEPSAFTRTLSGGKKFPLLWQHDPSSPIGTVEATETPQGLLVKGQLLLSDATAMKAYQLLKANVIRGLSIGYETVKDSIEDGVRHLKELRLWEVSVVTFPMNEMATVTSVKAMSDDDRARHLKSICTHLLKAMDHLKAMSDVFDDDTADDLALTLDEGDDEEKALVVELRKLVEQTSALTTS